MKADFYTIRVRRNSIKTLNIIAAHTGEKQYEVVERLANTELGKLNKKQFAKSKKLEDRLQPKV